MNSCFLEILFFIYKNNIKKLVSSIFKKYYYINKKELIWNQLKKKYE